MHRELQEVGRDSVSPPNTLSHHTAGSFSRKNTWIHFCPTPQEVSSAEYPTRLKIWRKALDLRDGGVPRQE